MGNMPLFCWGNDLEPTVDKNGYLVGHPSGRVVPVSAPRAREPVRNLALRGKKTSPFYRVNPETFFLLTG